MLDKMYILEQSKNADKGLYSNYLYKKEHIIRCFVRKCTKNAKKEDFFEKVSICEKRGD